MAIGRHALLEVVNADHAVPHAARMDSKKRTARLAARFFFGYEWQTTLVVIMLSLFMLGVALGLAVSWSDLPRLRREMAALKCELSQKNKSDVHAVPSY